MWCAISPARLPADGDDWFGGIQSENAANSSRDFFAATFPPGMPDKSAVTPRARYQSCSNGKMQSPRTNRRRTGSRATAATPRIAGKQNRYLHALLLQCPREAQMEAGKSVRIANEASFVRTLRSGVSTRDSTQELLGNFNDSDQRHFGAIGYQFNPRFPHARPAIP